MFVKDVMNSKPVTIGSKANVIEAKDLMEKNHVKKIVVVGNGGNVEGILTNSDVAKALPSSATTLDMYEMGYLLSKLTVEKAMCSSVKTVSENEPIEDAARLMSDYDIGCLPVVKEGILVGILEMRDVFNTFVSMFSTKNSGVRAVALMDEKPGQLAELAKGIAAIDGNIVSLVTSDLEDNNHRRVTVKAAGVTKDQMKNLLSQIECKIEDIRNV